MHIVVLHSSRLLHRSAGEEWRCLTPGNLRRQDSQPPSGDPTEDESKQARSSRPNETEPVALPRNRAARTTAANAQGCYGHPRHRLGKRVSYLSRAAARIPRTSAPLLAVPANWPKLIRPKARL